jgi:CO dehydrogenase nickel-insertion accessory protein CooC1
LVVVDPSLAAVRMAADLNHMVAGIQKGEGPATEHLESPDLAELAMDVYRKARIKGVLAVLNRVPDAVTEGYLAQRLSEEADIESLGTLAEDFAIANSWLRGFPLVAPGGRDDMAQVVSNLERAEESHLETMVPGLHS